MTDPMTNATTIQYLQFDHGYGTITTPAAGPRIVSQTDTAQGVSYVFTLPHDPTSNTLYRCSAPSSIWPAGQRAQIAISQYPLPTLVPTTLISATGAGWDQLSNFTYSLFFYD